jgi:hypothetical protein
MRAIIFSIYILISTAGLQAQSIFDTASCGGVNKLNGYSADKIFAKSKEWVTANIIPLSYTENESSGTIMVTAMDDYIAGKNDKVSRRKSGKFEYTFLVTAKDGYYSYNFVNVKYIPKSDVKTALEEPEKQDAKALKINKKTWERISRSAFKQLEEKGKNFDAFMQKC